MGWLVKVVGPLAFGLAALYEAVLGDVASALVFGAFALTLLQYRLKDFFSS